MQPQRFLEDELFLKKIQRMLNGTDKAQLTLLTKDKGLLIVPAPGYMLENNKTGFIQALLFIAIEYNLPLTTKYLITLKQPFPKPDLNQALCGRDYIGGAINSQTKLLLKTLKDYPHGISPTDKDGNLPLHKAVQMKHLPVIKVLAEQQTQYDQPNKHGESALQLACLKKSLDSVQFLYEKGADLNYVNHKNGNTALHYACEAGDLACLKFLLEKGANPNTANHEGRTPLHIATNREHKALVKLLVEDYHVDVSKLDNNGNTALHYSAWNDDSEIVALLAKHSDDVDSQGQHQRTPLMIACKAIKPNNVAALLAEKADVNIRNKDHETAGHQLFHYNSGQGPRIEILKLLFAHGYQDTPDKKGNKLLHEACFFEANIECIEFLISKTNDVNELNLEGQTALCRATRLVHSRTSYDTVELLLKHNADANIHGPQTTSPLNNIAGQSTIDMCTNYNAVMDLAKLLIQYNANVNQGALAEAIREHSLQMVELLLDNGANVKAKDLSDTFRHFNRDQELSVIKITMLILSKAAQCDFETLKPYLDRLTKSLKIYSQDDRRYLEIWKLDVIKKYRLDCAKNIFQTLLDNEISQRIQVKNGLNAGSAPRDLRIIQEGLNKINLLSTSDYQTFVMLCQQTMYKQHPITRAAISLKKFKISLDSKGCNSQKEFADNLVEKQIIPSNLMI